MTSPKSLDSSVSFFSHSYFYETRSFDLTDSAVADAIALLTEAGGNMKHDVLPLEAWSVSHPDLSYRMISDHLYDYPASKNESYVDRLGKRGQYNALSARERALALFRLPTDALGGKPILNFCKAIGVHPAHFESVRNIDLPVQDWTPMSPATLGANILIIRDSSYSVFDRSLAHRALSNEFLIYQEHVRKNQMVAALAELILEQRSKQTSAISDGYNDHLDRSGVEWNALQHVFKLTSLKRAMKNDPDQIFSPELFRKMSIEEIYMSLMDRFNGVHVIERKINDAKEEKKACHKSVRSFIRGLFDDDKKIALIENQLLLPLVHLTGAEDDSDHAHLSSLVRDELLGVVRYDRERFGPYRAFSGAAIKYKDSYYRGTERLVDGLSGAVVDLFKLKSKIRQYEFELAMEREDIKGRYNAEQVDGSSMARFFSEDDLQSIFHTACYPENDGLSVPVPHIWHSIQNMITLHDKFDFAFIEDSKPTLSLPAPRRFE